MFFDENDSKSGVEFCVFRVCALARKSRKSRRPALYARTASASRAAALVRRLGESLNRTNVIYSPVHYGLARPTSTQKFELFVRTRRGARDARRNEEGGELTSISSGSVGMCGDRIGLLRLRRPGRRVRQPGLPAWLARHDVAECRRAEAATRCSGVREYLGIIP